MEAHRERFHKSYFAEESGRSSKILVTRCRAMALHCARWGSAKGEFVVAKNVPRRGSILPFQQQDLIKKAQSTQEAADEQNSKCINAKLYEIKGHLQRWRQEGKSLEAKMDEEPMGKQIHAKIKNTMENLQKKDAPMDPEVGGALGGRPQSLRWHPIMATRRLDRVGAWTEASGAKQPSGNSQTNPRNDFQNLMSRLRFFCDF